MHIECVRSIYNLRQAHAWPPWLSSDRGGTAHDYLTHNWKWIILSSSSRQHYIHSLQNEKRQQPEKGWRDCAGKLIDIFLINHHGHARAHAATQNIASAPQAKHGTQERVLILCCMYQSALCMDNGFNEIFLPLQLEIIRTMKTFFL